MSHEAIMKKASLILLWAAIALFVLGFVVPLYASMAPTNPYESGNSLTLLQFFNALHGGISSAILPFIGSAVVWFMQNGRGGAA